MMMIERLARMLFERTKLNGGDYRGDVDTGWPDFADDARAIILAMRKPDEQMLAAAAKIDLAPGVEFGGEQYWSAMIQAAADE